MKGIVFAGCSFTWGEGLELYSDLPTLNLESIKRYGYHFPDSGYYMPKSHLKFIESNRFSRLVSHHLVHLILFLKKMEEIMALC